jgi:hypothetical protein
MIQNLKNDEEMTVCLETHNAPQAPDAQTEHT